MKTPFTFRYSLLLLLTFFGLLCQAQWTTQTDINTMVSEVMTSDVQSIGTSDGKTWVVFWKEVPAPQYYEVRAQLLDEDGMQLLGPNGMLVNNVVPMSTWTAIWSIALGKEDELYVGFNGTGGSNEAYVHKISTAGVQLWGNNGVVVGTGFDVKIFPLSNDEAIVHWLPANQGMLQKFSPAGLPLWSSPVMIDPLVAGHKTSAGEMAELSNGDFVILIHDRSGFGINSIFHAQRYTTLGTPVWTAPVPIANASTVFNRRYTLVQDLDTLFLGYTVSPGSDFQSYLQRINPDGTLPWGINGSDFATQTVYFEMNTKAAYFGSGSDYVWAICEFSNTSQSEYGEYVQKFDKVSGARQFTNNAKMVFPVSADMQSHKGDLQLVNDMPFFITSFGWNNGAMPIDLVATLLDANGDFAWPDTTHDVATSLESKFRYAFTTPVQGQSVCVWVEDRDSIGESRAFAQNVLADECPPPTATFTTSLTGLNANLVCTTPDATTASWQFSDNTTGTGLTVNHTFPSTGMWIITLTVTNDCGTDVLIDTIYITSVGIENPESKRETFVFPNPADDQFTIQYTLTSQGENLGISIYNAGGQRVAELRDLPRTEGLHTAVMDCSRLAEGVYQCVLRTGKKIRSERFVIIR